MLKMIIIFRWFGAAVGVEHPRSEIGLEVPCGMLWYFARTMVCPPMHALHEGENP